MKCTPFPLILWHLLSHRGTWHVSVNPEILDVIMSGRYSEWRSGSINKSNNQKLVFGVVITPAYRFVNIIDFAATTQTRNNPDT